MTQDTLALCVEDCRDHGMQQLILEDTVAHLWPGEDAVQGIVLLLEDVEYSAQGFHMAEVLDIAWSSCCNGLN